jgi:hypothetical protein
VRGASLGIALACALLGCASGARWQAESEAAPDADLAAYATFGFAASADASAPLAVRDARLAAAIRAQLLEKGYREVERAPDLQIGVTMEARPREKTTPPMRVGVGVGSWGGHVGTSVGTSVPVGPERVTTVAETRLTIRAIDPKGHREVWVGSATGEVAPGAEADAVEKAVAAALKGFPERRR